MKHQVFVTGLLLWAASASGQPVESSALKGAQNEVANGDADWVFRGEVRATTDHRERGVSYSLNEPSLQLLGAVVHSSGAFGELELSTVSTRQYPGGSGIRLQAVGGYRWGDPDGVQYEGGLHSTVYPGSSQPGVAGYDVVLDPSTGDVIDLIPQRTTVSPEFSELFAAVSYKGFSVRYFQTVSKNFAGIDAQTVCPAITDLSASRDCLQGGNRNSQGSDYLQVDYVWRVSKSSRLAFQIGRQRVKNFDDFDFTSYQIEWRQALNPFVLSVGLTGATARNRDAYRVALDNGETRDIANSRLYLAIARSF
jgi:hypothetical protein